MLDCPKCKTKTQVINTYRAGKSGHTQRLQCPKCLCVLTAVTITKILHVDPERGQGAGIVARQIQQGKLKV